LISVSSPAAIPPGGLIKTSDWPGAGLTGQANVFDLTIVKDRKSQMDKEHAIFV
jgi:hypothetical protein